MVTIGRTSHDRIDADGSIPPAKRWRALTILIILYALSLLDRQILNLLVDPIKHDIGASDIQMSLLQGFAFATFYCICGVPLGLLADRVSRRGLIFCGVAIWSLSAASCGLARTYPQLLVARFMVGMGEAALLPAAYSLISAIFPRHRVTTALGIFSTGAMIGAGLSSAVGGGVIWLATRVDIGAAVGLRGLHSWQTAFLLTGAPGLPLAALVLLIPEPHRQNAMTAADATRLWPFLRRRRAFLMAHLIGFSCLALPSYAGGAWMPTYLTRRYGLKMTVIGPSIGAVVALFGIVGMVIGARWVDRALARGHLDAHFRYFVFGGTAIAILGGSAPLCTSPLGTILLFGSTNLFVTVLAVAAAALQLATPVELRGRISALFLMIFNLIAMGCGPLAVSTIAKYGLGDPTRIGPALAIVYAMFGLGGAVTFLIGLPAARGAIGNVGTATPNHIAFVESR